MNRTTSHLGLWAALGLAGGVGLTLLLRRSRSGFSFHGRVAVITGGSRGLGLLLARELAGQGARLALLARSEAELQHAQAELQAAGADVLAVPCDLRRREQVESAIQRVVGHFGRLDVLVNNAGIIQVGPLEHMTVQDFEDALAVHLFGPLYTTLAALPHLRQAGEGRLVNISSIGGRVAVPHLLPYVASKSALAGLSEGLRAELRKDNILVTTVYPALMRTGSPPNARFKGKYEHEYAWFAFMDALPLLSMSAGRAARRIVAACRRGSPRLALGATTKVAFLLNELFPALTASLLSTANQFLPGPAPGGSPQSHSGWESRSSLAPSFLTRLSDRK